MAHGVQRGAFRESLKQCVEVVKINEPGHYLTCSLWPKSKRPAFLGLRNLRIEIAGIVHRNLENPNRIVALSRLEWWRASIATLYDPSASIPKHPICQVLHPMIHQHNLSRHWFQRLLDGYENEMNAKQISSIEHMELDCEMRHSVLIYLALECLDVRDVTTDHIASHIGKAQGLVDIARTLAFQARHKPSKELAQFIPAKLGVALGISFDTNLLHEDHLKQVVFELSSQALAHLEHAHTITPGIPKSSHPALLPSVYTLRYLKVLEKVDFDVKLAEEVMPRYKFGTQMRLLFNSVTGRPV